MTGRYIVADVFDGLAQLDDGSVDLVITSPPFLALRSYLPADHPDKDKEIGSEATPAEFIDVMLEVTKELRRVLAPHGSLCVELGDTYTGSGGGGGNYYDGGMREGQPGFTGSADADREALREANAAHWRQKNQNKDAWPLAKSKTLIPQLYEVALAYGFNPLTGQESPAGKWRIRNVVTWARPNPPVGALGDKWRPATSDVVVAATSDKRYWDDLATRKPHQPQTVTRQLYGYDSPKHLEADASLLSSNQGNGELNSAGAPLLDYWEIPPTGYSGAHYAVYPPALVEPLVKAMCPQKVCRECGEPSRRIVEQTEEYAAFRASKRALGTTEAGARAHARRASGGGAEGWGFSNLDDAGARGKKYQTTGFTDCGHDNYRPGIVLDPFAGTGTTLMVATGHGYDAIGIDIDERNAELALERVGPFLLDIEA